MNRSWRAGAVLIVTLAFLTGCAGGGGAAGKRAGGAPPFGASTGSPDLSAYYDQKLSWSSCGDGFQCAKLTVPLDYGQPDRKSIKLAVIRLPASDKGKRIGSLVVNPGGPGGSGIEYARNARTIIDAPVRQRFDVVGFDPRGVGESAPVHCMTARQLDHYVALDATPDSNAEEQALVEGSKEFGQECEQHSADLLSHVGTVNAARDMDVLRAALGDDGLTYLGKSYGTLLGTYYAELFPKHTRALVLDGAIDPKLSAFEVNETQAEGFETALGQFVADCVKRTTCPLGHDGVKAGTHRLDTFLARLDHTPIKTSLGDGRKLNQPLAQIGIASALYDKGAWQYLRLGLQQAFAGDGKLLMRLADLLIGRGPDGTYSNQTEANMAVNCVDQSWPHQVSAYEKAAKEADRKAPHFGEFIAWGSLPCAFWPVPPDKGPSSFDAAGAKPILVVGTTRDPATPYAWAKALASQLDTGVLLTRVGDGHTAYTMGSSCIDHAVDDYFLTGTPPKAGTVCHLAGDGPPPPVGAA